MKLGTFEAICALLVFSAGLFGAFLPSRILRDGGSLAKLSIANSFSGGIFLGAGLLHLLYDASDTLNNGYPVAGLLACCSFLLLLSVDRVILQEAHLHDILGNGGGSTEAPPSINQEESPFLRRHTHHGEPHHDHGKRNRKTVVFVLFVALSIHSIVAGLSLGMQDKQKNAMTILIAIIVHKWAAACSLGVALIMANVEIGAQVKLLVGFCTVTPAGIFIGMALQALLSGPKFENASAFFLAFAAGTFIYVALMEVLADEFASAKTRKVASQRLLSVVLGFGAMALLAIWV